MSDAMTKDELQQFAVRTAELLDRKLAERDEVILREVHGARMAAERAANIGSEVITRIDRLETTQRDHGISIEDFKRDLQKLGERVDRLEGALLGKAGE